MDDLQSEKEQIEEMRAWWSEYGNYVLGGIAIAVIGLFGFNQYRNSTLESQYQASGLYEQLANLVVDGDVDEAEVIIGQLTTDFGDSAYAIQGRLAMSRLYMDQNRDEDAAAELRDLLAGVAAEEFKHVARLRLAKVLLYQDKAQEAVDLLEPHEGENAFAQRYADTLGDAYVALDRVVDARAAYQRALIESGTGATVDQNFVRLKLLDLPVDAVAVEAPAEAADEPADAPVDEAAEDVADAEETTPEEAE